MIKTLLLIFLSALIFSGLYGQQINNHDKLGQQDSTNWICIPGFQVGTVNANTSESDLIRIYGAENVIRDTIDLGEGFFVIGTVLFPETNNELSITWKDTTAFSKPDWIYIEKENTEWRTNTGISIGTSLKELEKINEKEFYVLGYGWDYSGTISNWNGGKLDGSKNAEKGRGLIIRLGELGDHELSNGEYEMILGDKEFISSHSVFQKLNPKVDQMIIIF